MFFDPTKAESVIPTDLGGIDRLEYHDFSSLKDGLRRLLEQQFGAPGDVDAGAGAGHKFNALIEELRVEALVVVAEHPGIQMGGIAARLGVEIGHAQTIVRTLVGDSLETHGSRRGTRYYHPDDLPPDPDPAIIAEIDQTRTRAELGEPAFLSPPSAYCLSRVFSVAAAVVVSGARAVEGGCRAGRCRRSG